MDAAVATLLSLPVGFQERVTMQLQKCHTMIDGQDQLTQDLNKQVVAGTVEALLRRLNAM